jgi:hypothetical protein
MIEVDIEVETEDGMDRGRGAGMRESTAKPPEQRIDAGMDQAKDSEIE